METIRQQLLAQLTRGQRFSDVQVNVSLPLRVRTAAGLMPVGTQPVTAQDLDAFLQELRPDSSEWQAVLDANGGQVDFGASFDGIRFRCNLYRFGGGRCGLTLRRLDTEIPRLDSLGLPVSLNRLLERSKGLLLVTGPTGAGKSTTLAAIVNHLNDTRYGHIVTIEDPIEYEFSSNRCVISQREIGTDCVSFAAALRSAMRQRPDVIMVGEMRDMETVETALSAAESGHLVLATLHTINAIKTMERITNFFTGSDKANAQGILASVLIGVVSQVLVEQAGGGGYELCYELMINNAAIASLIREGKIAHIANVLHTSRAEGMVTLNRVLAQKVADRRISKKDALYYSYNPEELERELAG